MSGKVHTVLGPIVSGELGVTLVHEQILVDFIGARGFSRERYDSQAVHRTMLPFLQELKSQGVNALVECTPPCTVSYTHLTLPTN